MRKVTSINLNNNAFQIDEEGFESLRRYLDDATRALAGNPDREEILADLEQAIADKCRATLGQYKNVVSTEEMDRILQEMGPVADGTQSTGASGEAQPEGSSPGVGAGVGSSGLAPRRLYRIRQGMKWAGVCTGLATYAGVDVSLVRVAVVLITVFTAFVPCIAIYIGLAFILPVATTSEEMAAASGAPFNAQELVDRVKKKHEQFRDERRAQRQLNREARWWSQATSPQPQPAPGYAAQRNRRRAAARAHGAFGGLVRGAWLSQPIRCGGPIASAGSTRGHRAYSSSATVTYRSGSRWRR